MGTPQDRVLRQFLVKESEKEKHKTNLLGLLVANSIPFDNQANASEWEGKVKRIWNSYLALEFGMDVPPDVEKELQMQEFYMNKIKALKPKISIGKDGKPLVSGLSSLAD